jgi:hypothetical protein
LIYPELISGSVITISYVNINNGVKMRFAIKPHVSLSPLSHYDCMFERSSEFRITFLVKVVVFSLTLPLLRNKKFLFYRHLELNGI